MNVPAEKPCSMCGETKPAEAFSKNGDSLRSACRGCHSAHRRQQRVADPERFRAEKRRWSRANPDRVKAQQAKDYERHRERRLEAMRRYRETHTDPRPNLRIAAKARAIEHYAAGNIRCACCGERTRGFLGLTSLDALERQLTQAMQAGYQPRMMQGADVEGVHPFRCQLYEWMAIAGWPPGPRVLCHNCHYAERTVGRCPHCGPVTVPDTPYQRRKRDVLRHYGGTCACCGVDDLAFLVLHRKGGYSAEERRLGLTHRAYGYVVANGYPDVYEVLCRNCQLTITHRGVCAHEDPAASDPWVLARPKAERRSV